MKEELKLRKTEKTEWKFRHRGVECKVVFWKPPALFQTEHVFDTNDIYPHGGIWNSYFLLREEFVGERFKELVAKRRKHSYPSGDKYYYNYSRLPVEMAGGLTYYDLNKTNHAKPKRVAEFGNDYNHIWNTNEFYNEKVIANDLIEAVDKVLNYLGVDEIKNDYF